MLVSVFLNIWFILGFFAVLLCYLYFRLVKEEDLSNEEMLVLFIMLFISGGVSFNFNGSFDKRY